MAAVAAACTGCHGALTLWTAVRRLLGSADEVRSERALALDNAAAFRKCHEMYSEAELGVRLLKIASRERTVLELCRLRAAAAGRERAKREALGDDRQAPPRGAAEAPPGDAPAGPRVKADAEAPALASAKFVGQEIERLNGLQLEEMDELAGRADGAGTFRLVIACLGGLRAAVAEADADDDELGGSAGLQGIVESLAPGWLARQRRELAARREERRRAAADAFLEALYEAMAAQGRRWAGWAAVGGGGGDGADGRRRAGGGRAAADGFGEEVAASDPEEEGVRPRRAPHTPRPRAGGEDEAEEAAAVLEEARRRARALAGGAGGSSRGRVLASLLGGDEGGSSGPESSRSSPVGGPRFGGRSPAADPFGDSDAGSDAGPPPGPSAEAVVVASILGAEEAREREAAARRELRDAHRRLAAAEREREREGPGEGAAGRPPGAEGAEVRVRAREALDLELARNRQAVIRYSAARAALLGPRGRAAHGKSALAPRRAAAGAPASHRERHTPLFAASIV